MKISKQRPSERSLDYEFLRSEGLKYIEDLSHRIWTDYNIHDPGVTIHEVLCYALTDLGSRIATPIEDMLAQGPKHGMLGGLPAPRAVLPTSPVTVNDYRKLLIDIYGVKNAWLQEHESPPLYLDPQKALVRLAKAGETEGPVIGVRGVYDVLLEVDENALSEGKALSKAKLQKKYEEISAEVLKTLNANRNLCEDFIDTVTFVQPEEFMLCADIEVAPESDVDLIHAKIACEIQAYLSPPVQFYSLKEMLTRRRSLAGVFEGPVLSNGFIDDNELEASSLRQEIRLSDIINIIMDIKGVTAVKEILVNPVAQKGPPQEKWVIPVTAGKQAHLKLGNCRCNYFKNLLSLNADDARTQAYVDKLCSPARAELTYEDIPVPRGTFRDLSRYYSVQNHFPLNYGIGKAGPLEPVTDERVAQVRQLRAFLLFFDQLLANYFAQLGNAWKFFSLEDTDRTYFTQRVADVQNPEKLYKDYPALCESLNGLVEDDRMFLERRNRFMDHLLARFNEDFTEYVLLMFSQSQAADRDQVMRDSIRAKRDFLRDYHVIGCRRAQSFDYTAEGNLWDTNNTAGLEQRVARLLGMRNLKRRDLSVTRLENIDFEIYKVTSSGGADAFRFRVFDDNADRSILLSSNIGFPDEKTALSELEKTMSYALAKDKYQLLESSDNRFYFNIMDDSGAVIARRIEFFDTKDACEQAMEHLFDLISRRSDSEGFFVVEHILLRPIDPGTVWQPSLRSDCTEEGTLDPYSFRLSVILPNWPERFKNMEFRRFVDKTIRMETPAHILPKICWLSREDMRAFAVAYRGWLESKPAARKKALKNLTEVLQSTRSRYPESKLSACPEADDGRDVFLLNKNIIGTQRG